MSAPVTATVSGAFGAAGALSSTDVLLPPSWPHAFVLITSAWVARMAAVCVVSVPTLPRLPVFETWSAYGVLRPTMPIALRW
jgi:hypothetical protein